jgi:hypothetical protein
MGVFTHIFLLLDNLKSRPMVHWVFQTYLCPQKFHNHFNIMMKLIIGHVYSVIILIYKTCHIHLKFFFIILKLIKILLVYFGVS